MGRDNATITVNSCAYMAKKKISEFRPQSQNANSHTQRGLGMLSKSMEDHGFFGAMTSSADGEIFDGSARLETAYERFGDSVEPIIVDADGTRPIIVRRIDIPNADDPKAKKMAIAANRIASVDLDWNMEVLAEISQEIDISDMFFDDELAKLAEQRQEVIDHQEPDFLKFSDNDSLPAYASDRSGGTKQPIPIVVGSRTMQRWNEYKESIGIKNDTAAFENLLDSSF